MHEPLLLNKKVGETPLQCIERFRAGCLEYEKIKMTYAGRLDPMASGLLLVLAGEKVHEKESFLKLDKTYECSAILGITTDTYDVLGIPTTTPARLRRVDPSSFEEGCLALAGRVVVQKYPPYSSKTIDGVQMHTLARGGKLDGKEIPTQEVTIKSISNIVFKKESLRTLAQQIVEYIHLVQGDFRQQEIMDAWQKLAEEDREVEIVSFTIDVSGGTYIRGVVHELGGCVWKLHRTRVGEYFLP